MLEKIKQLYGEEFYTTGSQGNHSLLKDFETKKSLRLEITDTEIRIYDARYERVSLGFFYRLDDKINELESSLQKTQTQLREFKKLKDKNE